MATILDECNSEEHPSVVHFLWAKGLDAKDIHKETFPVYGVKCLSCKEVHYWVTNISLMMMRLERRCRNG
jgi:hypothetical protein